MTANYFHSQNALSTGLTAAVLFIVGQGTLLFVLSAAVISISSSSWPTIPGEIVMSDPAAWPDIKYTYHFSNRERPFTGRNIRARLEFGSLQFVLDGDRERLVNKYPKGTRVTVFYNPENPRETVLEPGFNGRFMFPLVLGYLFTLPGFFIIGRALNVLLFKKRHSTILSFVIGGLTSFAAIVLLICLHLRIPDLPDVWKTIRSPYRGTIPGEVIIAEKRVDRGFDDKSALRSYPYIVYTYEINLVSHVESFTSEAVRPWKGREQGNWEHRDDNPLNTYKQGMAVTVYYDPSDPGESVLEPGDTRGLRFLPYGVALLFVIVWIGFGSLLKRKI